MSLEKICRELEKIEEQLKDLQEKKKELEEQKIMAEDAASIKVIRRLNISPAKLQLLNRLSEDEIFNLLKKKEEEISKDEVKKIV